MKLHLVDKFDKMGLLVTVVTALLLVTAPAASQRCSFRINGDLGQPQPIYVFNNRLLMPNGNTGQIQVNTNDQIRIACPGSTIRHPNAMRHLAVETARCVNGNQISGAGWLRANGAFGGLTCANVPTIIAENTRTTCFGANTIIIRVGFLVDNVFHTWYRSCFDTVRMEVLYAWYDQNAQYGVNQNGVPRPNSWTAGGFYTGVNIDRKYLQTVQKQTIGGIVGTNILNRYIHNDQFLTRGHLAAKSDFPFASAQLATFYFINAAPQWETFNSGNWKVLEARLRARIAQQNHNTVIYTGTFGTLQLLDGSNRLQDIYLYRNGNIRRVPVPLYFYKVAYDANRGLGTAFIGINNPHITTAEARQQELCTDRCRNNGAFSWLNWQPDNTTLGYSFCCSLADFQARVRHLPNVPALGVDRLLF